MGLKGGKTNLYLNDETKSRLALLARMNNRSPSNQVAQLVNQEYERVNPKARFSLEGAGASPPPHSARRRNK
jgi:hypothetical protein